MSLETARHALTQLETVVDRGIRISTAADQLTYWEMAKNLVETLRAELGVSP